MGGDHAPRVVVEGAEIARTRYPKLRFVFYGDSGALKPLLAIYPALAASSTVVHTDVCVAGDEKPSLALRKGRNSSMRLAIDAVHEGAACAAVSAGNTGALMAMSKVVYKTLPGISRPAIVGLVPTPRGRSVMLDLGANVEADAATLFQFAIMGDAFARAVLGIARPSVGILNVGSEEIKGHEEVKVAHGMLRQAGDFLNFHGFVEGTDINHGTTDVVVADGFTGNIALKTLEGMALLWHHHLGRMLAHSWVSKFAALLLRPGLQKISQEMDPRHYNGAMFIGLNGITVKSHGSTDGYGFANAIGVAIELATHHVNQKIIEEIKNSSIITEGEDTQINHNS